VAYIPQCPLSWVPVFEEDECIAFVKLLTVLSFSLNENLDTSGVVGGERANFLELSTP
jgi:hypothetical protein